jgi:regulator of protease activity HflC (stomatin/prohibitin superfamily)
MNMLSFTFGNLVVAAIVGIVVWMAYSYNMVQEGFNYTVLRLGKYTRTITPGYNTVWWWFNRVGTIVNMREQFIPVPSQDVITRDNAIVSVDGVVFFRIVNAELASYAVSGLEGVVPYNSKKPLWWGLPTDIQKKFDYLASELVNDKRQTGPIATLKQTTLRAVIGALELDAVTSQREIINEHLLRVIREAAEPWGVEIMRVEIKDINVRSATGDKSMQTAMEHQMIAERERRAQILTAEGFKQKEILEAQGRREAAFLMAEARERQAEAEARATRVVGEAAKGNMASINYFVAQDYFKALGQLASSPNQKVMIMPMNFNGLVGLGETFVQNQIYREITDGSPMLNGQAPPQ